MKFKLRESRFDPEPAELLADMMLGPPRIINPRHDFQQAVEAAFYLICEELGIADRPNTVEFVFLSRTGSGPNTTGTTDNRYTDPAQVELKMQMPFQLLPTLAHEMVHVRDTINGAFTFDIEAGRKLFHGQPVRVNRKKKYEELTCPDEIESYERMYPLTFAVMEKVDPKLLTPFTESYEQVRKMQKIGLAFTKKNKPLPEKLGGFYMVDWQYLKMEMKEAKEREAKTTSQMTG